MSLDLSKKFFSFQIIDQQNVGGGGDVTISGSDVLREQIEDVIYDALTAGDNILITYDDIPDPGIIRIATTSSIAVDNVTVGGATEIGTTGSGIDVIHFTDGVGGILCTDFTISGTEHKVYNAGGWVSYMGTDYWDDSLSGGITWNDSLNQYDVSGTFNLYTTGTWPIAFRPTKVRLTISGSPTGYIDFIVQDVHGQTIAIDEDYIGGVVDIAVNQDGDYGWQGADLDRLSYYVGGGIAITNIEFFTTHYSLKSSWNTPLDIYANSITLGAQSVVLREAAYYSGGSAVTGLGMTSPLMMYNDDVDEAMMWINKGTGNNLFFMDPNSYNTGYPDDTFTGYSNLFFIHGDFENAITGANNNVLLATSSSHLTTGQYNVFIGSGSNRVTTGSYNVFLGNSVGQDQDQAGDIDNSQYNIGIGYRVFSWPSTTIGQYNVALGFEAGYRMDGTGSVAIGYQAAKFATQDDYIVAIGYGAASNSIGTDCVAIGREAGNSAYGNGNIAIGYRSQYRSNSGSYNVTMGYMAGNYLASGANQNVLLGYYAGGYGGTQAGDYNVGIGAYALHRFQSGTYNVAIGYYSGAQSYGSDNVFIGGEAGYLATSVASCVYIGRRAGYGNTGSSNTAIGYYAGYQGDGIYNVFLGFYAGRLDSGGYNTLIGAYAGEQSGSQSYNTHVGYQAGRYSAAQRNIFVGYNAGRDNDGAQNTAIGYEAGLVGNGNYNVFIGEIAGRNASGASNVFLGFSAGASNTSSQAIAIGYEALYSNTDDSNVAVGYKAGRNSSANNEENVFIGLEAGYQANGDYMICIGSYAGRSGVSNLIAMGNGAGRYATGATNSILIGAQTNYWGSGAANNLIIGHFAGYGASGQTTGDYNTFIGQSTGRGFKSGSRNVCLGHEAGYSFETGSYNVFLGYQAGYSETGSNKLYIESSNSATPLIYGEFDTNLIRINGELDVTGDIGTNADLYVDGTVNAFGDLTVSGTATFGSDVWYEDTFWDDIRVPGEQTGLLGVRNPDLILLQDSPGFYGVWCYGFDADNREEVFFSIQLPHSYKEGTDIYPHIHWSPTTASGGFVKWGLEYTWTNINDDFAETTVIVTDDTADGTALKHQVVGYPTISGAGMKISSMLMCRLFRRAPEDTYPHDAALLEIDVHFEIDSPGSRQEYIK